MLKTAFDSKSSIAIERQIQRCLKSIQKWTDENQSACIFHDFTNADLDLTLFGASIPVQVYGFEF